MEKMPFYKSEDEESVPSVEGLELPVQRGEASANEEIKSSVFSKIGKVARLAGAIGAGILSGDKISASENSDSEAFSQYPQVESVEQSDPREDWGASKRLTDAVNGMVDKGEGSYRQILTALYGDKTDEILKIKEAYRQKSDRYFATNIDVASLDRVSKIKDKKLSKGTAGEFDPGRSRVFYDSKQIGVRGARLGLSPELERAEVISHEFFHGLQDKKLFRIFGRSADAAKNHIKFSDKHMDYAFGQVAEREARIADLNRIHQMAFGRPVLTPEDAIRALIVTDQYNRLSLEDILPVMKEAGLEYNPSDFRREKILNVLSSNRFKNRENSTMGSGANEFMEWLYRPEVTKEQRSEMIKEIILKAPGLAMTDTASDSGEMVA